MSGAAAVSAAKNRRSREQTTTTPTQNTKQPNQPNQKNVQFQSKELTLLEALHQHDFRLRRSEEALKILLANENTTNQTTGATSSEFQDTLDLFNERILSLEKYIDDELSKSLTLKEKEDKEGEDVIYGKINGLESLLKDLKTELVRIQSASRDTSVSFLKYKGETDNQFKELKETIKTLTASVREAHELASANAQQLSALQSASAAVESTTTIAEDE